MSGIEADNQLGDLLTGMKVILFFDIGEGKTDHRISPLELPICFPSPDRQALEQIRPARVIYREKLLHHIHGQSLSETSGPGDQGDVISALPPFPDKIRFINIHIIIFNYFFITLNSDSYRSCHKLNPP